MNQGTIKEELASRQIEWHFLPPAAPHMGGSWERLIRSVKKALAVTLKCQAPPEEVLCTLLAEAEHLINSRPLTVTSNDPNDPEALTPNHFLIGTSSGTVPWVCPAEEHHLGRRWQHSQRLVDHFWNRWLKEYLPTLVKNTKWFGPGDPVTVGQLVYLVDKSKGRGSWTPGLIVAVYPGKDGRPRVVDLKTKLGIIRRPVVQLLPLLPTEK